MLGCSWPAGLRYAAGWGPTVEGSGCRAGLVLSVLQLQRQAHALVLIRCSEGARAAACTFPPNATGKPAIAPCLRT